MRFLLPFLALLGCRADKGGAPVDEETVPGGEDTGGCEDGTPGAAEVCDGVDNNCDGEVDEGVTDTFYADTDGDGFGDDALSTDACETPDGYAAVGGDCDDADGESYPGAAERCDGLDNDCDEAVDEDVTTAWYADADGDSYGDAEATSDSCDPGEGYVADNTDCDDTNPDANPGGAEV